ncbi:beta-lactamase domain protein (plasmid) [Methylobacterium nodulans ORS 2060]|uniref:Beta-lactamase domain protein n=1 Tax=Methylobacterium nodulans (strain LMG 21967 / CNCM I-2342 / ORS 2060) TaxID=460265 RepID=B8IVK4_METNO|nr:beta-lactamase domain protein [Methylobacterium nodulans ORS 2060]
MTTNEVPVVYRIGHATVTRISEITAEFPAGKLLPDYDPALERPDPVGSSPVDAAGGQLTVSVHSWLVRIGGLTVLVDAGIGNGKTRASKLFDHLDTPWLDRLATAGARPEDVTHVLLTHLHTDHVGWNTVPGDGGWVPTFPNARTLMPHRGYELFMSPEGRARPNHDMFADSVLPVVAAGRTEFVPPEGGESLADFTYVPTPGHSPDHMSILLRSDGREALFAGDVLHHPVQVARPDWCSMFCEAPEEARRSRLRMLDLAAERRLIWFSSHCAGTSAGTVARNGERFTWTFL